MNITKGPKRSAIRVGIYGTEGVGKTTFASKFDDAVFIDTEGSTVHMDVARFDQPEELGDVVKQINYVISNPGQFRTLVIDTVDWLEKLIFQNVCAEKKIANIEDLGYLNMELDEASFDDRMIKVYQALEIENKNLRNIDIVHLRGRIEKLEKLVPQINRTINGKEYAAVILDPTYKLGIGDENAADSVTAFCNAIDKIANTGASVVYAHHHSKGSQGSKASMDRASGSGVFARDADALLDMIELRIPKEKIEEAQAEYGEKCTGWRLDATLREFQRIEPVNLFFSYPLHEIDAGGILKEANLEENERSMENGREIRHTQQAGKKANLKERLADAIYRDEEFDGKRKTQKEYADEFGVSERTIRTYLRELEEDI